MENQSNVNNQNTQQIRQNPIDQSAQFPEKIKVNYWVISTVVIFVILLIGGAWFLLNIKGKISSIQHPINIEIPQPTSLGKAKQLSGSDFQILLTTNCRPKSQMVPATRIIDQSMLPITVNFKLDNFYCENEWHSDPNINITFSDGTQSYFLFDRYWQYDTELLKGDTTTEYKPNSKGMLIRTKDDIDQYIRLESANARFEANNSTWIEVYSIKKSKLSDIKLMTQTVLISGGNIKLQESLIRNGIETYNNSAAEYENLMGNLIKELLTPVGKTESVILDEQVNKLNQILFK